MKRNRLSLLLLCAALLLSACGMIRPTKEDHDTIKENQSDVMVSGSEATVLFDDTAVYAEPNDTSALVCVLNQGESVRFNKITGSGLIWVQLTQPVEGAWIRLEDLEVDGNYRELLGKPAADAPIYDIPDEKSQPLQYITDDGYLTITSMITYNGQTWCQLAGGNWMLLDHIALPCEVQVPDSYEDPNGFSIIGSWYFLHGISDNYAEEECWTFRADGTMTQRNTVYGQDLTTPHESADSGAPGVYVLDGFRLTISLTDINAGIYEYIVLPTADGIAFFPKDDSSCLLFTAQPHLGPNGSLTGGNGNTPQPTEPAQPTDPAVGGQILDSLVGSWQAFNGFISPEGWGGGSGFALYLCENGYGVLERGEGEIHNDTFNLNYTSSRLYGAWEIQGEIFRFTVTEDWFNADGSMIGHVFEMPFTATDDGFALEYYDDLWTFHNSTDWNGYLDDVRSANGGPTGNDLTGTRDVSNSNIDGLVGSWKMYEDDGNGYKIRHLFRFNADGSFDYTRNRMALDGSTWIPVETIDPYISYGGYYMLNGYFTIAWDAYEVSGLAVTVEGDTMTMSTVGDAFWEVQTGTFTRYDGSDNPQP